MTSSRPEPPESVSTHSLSLFDVDLTVRFPKRLEVSGKIHGNWIAGYAFLSHTRRVRLSPYSKRGLVGHLATDEMGRSVLVSPRPTTANPGNDGTLHLPGADAPEKISDGDIQSRARWLSPRVVAPRDESLEARDERCKQIVASWEDKFSIRQERISREGVRSPGLRRPQVGALYAALAHWSVSDVAATIVMPTGTGKTETMLALLVATRIPRLMVVVPTVALRDQIAEKFLTLGKLFEAGCLPDGTRPPIVAKLAHRPKTLTEVDDVFGSANVIVTTMQVVGRATPEIQERMAELSSHLFIDEAHHIAARTWAEFKRRFGTKPILQFTATPFRTDGKRVDGKFIYTYPLARAQNEGYFTPITFEPIVEFNAKEADRSIALAAAARLRSDLERGLDHVLMARADTTERADALLKIYQEELPEQNPVVIHNRIPPALRRERHDALRRRASRVVICVDMFGEGFDFPELKVAALHDRHKSLAITLQFIGRFTRDLRTVGNASIVANIADDAISNALRTLYAEDADWNFLLKVLSEAATERARKRAEVLEGFTEPLEDIPLQTLFPKMTAVVYKTTCDDWSPLKIEDVLPGARIYAGPIVNPHHNLAIFVTRDEEFVRWGSVKQILNVEWNLYVLHWNEALGLLFINSSNKDFHEPIAEAVGGSTNRIAGEEVYRTLGGIKRLTLTNLGLSHALGKNIRYTMFMGADIADGLTEAQKVNRRKSNLFGLGYEENEKVTIGCSSKGRFWSHRVAYDLSEWTDWCAHIGQKLLDSSISVEGVLANVIKARRVAERPPLVPVMVAWPEDFQSQPEERIDLRVGHETAPFYECEIDVGEYEETGPLTFVVTVGIGQAVFVVDISEEHARFRQTAGAAAEVVMRGKRRSLEDYFNDDPPIIHFANGDFLVFNELFELPRGGERSSFDPERITAWDWDGVDITHESQGDEKDRSSIQWRIIDRVLDGAYGDFEVVFDDDGSGEIADVVAVRRQERKISATLFHCKFSRDRAPGRRVDDLYAVCGQAQKSVHWRENPKRFLRHLIHREMRRQSTGRPSRIEKGSFQALQQLMNQSRELAFECNVVIVQPGLSKAQLTTAHRDLLGATESFLRETFSIPLSVIASA